MTSAILSKLSETYHKVLTTPQTILGPNHSKVLELWRRIDTLSDQEKEEMDVLYWALDFNVHDSANVAACDAAAEVVGLGFRNAAWFAAVDVTGKGVFGDATVELIGDVKNKVAYNVIMSYKKD
jgi:hypothetical protein